MTLFIVSFFAGVLTIAAPCILPLLPVIIGGSFIEASKDKHERQWIRPLIITASLAVSVILFTLLIKATTLLLDVPQTFWQVLSGSIVILLGIQYVRPGGWEAISAKSGLFERSNKMLGRVSRKKGILGPVLIGFSLGPVFSSCSPTYALIIATILPASFITGLAYLIAYVIGMSMMLLLISYLGTLFTAKIKWAVNPDGWFKKAVGILFILVGVLVITGLDKDIQTFILEQGWYQPIENIEKFLR